MGRRRGITGSPRSYIISGDWPYGGTVDMPVAVAYAQAFAANLAEAVGRRSVREVARAADLDHTTVRGLILGDRWADLSSIAKLEQTLGVRLWPDLLR